MKIARASIVAAAALASALGLIGLLRPVEAAPAAPAATGDILIHEVEYDSSQAGVDTAYEWLELYNATGQVITLTNWTITDATASDVIPTVAISPNGFVVVAASISFTVNYPGFTGTAVYLGGSIGSGLSNTGDRLTLRDDTGAIIDELSWGSNTSVFTLPVLAAGHSAERQPIGVDTDTAADFVDRNPPTPGYGIDPPPLPPAASPGSVLISAVHFDGYAPSDGDEGFRLTNAATQAITLTGWIARDNQYALPLTGALDAGRSLWLAKRAVTFTQQFGFKPDYEYEADTDPLVPNLPVTGGIPALSDNDTLAVRQGTDNWIDAVVWGAGEITDTGWITGWTGSNLQPYSNNSVARSGQILYRKLDEATGAILTDTNAALDWANDRADPVSGRKTMYPGWDLEALWQTAKVTATARLTVAIAPDNATRVISDLLGSARQSIKLEAHSFENVALAGVLTRTMQAHSVSVTILLEGGPVGGVDDHELWICQHVESAGGDCWFMINDASGGIHDRYDYLHAKLIVVDDRVVAISSENLSPASLPFDDFADGTLGQRGAYLLTDAPGVVARALHIWSVDFDPAHHRDLVAWGSPGYGAPPLGFTPNYTSGGSLYPIRYPAPLGLTAPLTFEVLSAPESSLRASDALLGLIAQAGPGDEIDVEQLDEPPHWGNSTGNPVDDPNLRLEALIAAASRGARVRLLLDAYFDDAASPASNEATRAYVESLRAISPALRSNLEVRRGNPTLGGLHNKMLLFQLGDRKIVHVGSLNGSETSNKVNREIALQVESAEAYDYLRAMFESDWAFRPRVYLPLVFRNFRLPANHLLVSQVYYLGSTSLITGSEWIQIYNPTAITISLSSYKIGDEETQGGGGFGFDGMWRFPPTATIGPGKKINVAFTFRGFYEEYGRDPDFAFFEGIDGVNKLTPYLAWTSAVTLTLANTGDEVLLVGPDDQIVDGVAWGTGALPGNVPCPAIAPPPFASLDRTPIGNDTDSCPVDFVVNPSPSP
jgi:phosphatidylserine/phosphatidylglycerophosphate/cardiolipin synthase-like enzyme